MSAIKQLLTGQNEFINPVFKAMTERERIPKTGKPLESAQKEAAAMVGGLLIAVKVTITQAAKIIQEMDLDEII